jgi:hypothetical protein
MSQDEGAAAESGGISGDGVAREPTEQDVREVRAISQGAEEMETSEDPEPRPPRELPAEGDVPGLKVLQSLMKATLFTDYFVYHARLRYLDRTPQERVARLIGDHPRFYRLCRLLDLTARAGLLFLVTVTLTAVAWGFVWRTFFIDLFPPPGQ